MPNVLPIETEILLLVDFDFVSGPLPMPPPTTTGASSATVEKATGRPGREGSEGEGPAGTGAGTELWLKLPTGTTRLTGFGGFSGILGGPEGGVIWLGTEEEEKAREGEEGVGGTWLSEGELNTLSGGFGGSRHEKRPALASFLRCTRLAESEL